jgi:hypothetical protein
VIAHAILHTNRLPAYRATGMAALCPGPPIPKDDARV